MVDTSNAILFKLILVTTENEREVIHIGCTICSRGEVRAKMVDALFNALQPSSMRWVRKVKEGNYSLDNVHLEIVDEGPHRDMKLRCFQLREEFSLTRPKQLKVTKAEKKKETQPGQLCIYELFIELFDGEKEVLHYGTSYYLTPDSIIKNRIMPALRAEKPSMRWVRLYRERNISYEQLQIEIIAIGEQAEMEKEVKPMQAELAEEYKAIEAQRKREEKAKKEPEVFSAENDESKLETFFKDFVTSHWKELDGDSFIVIYELFKSLEYATDVVTAATNFVNAYGNKIEKSVYPLIFDFSLKASKL